MKMKTESIIFDLDGTLWDSSEQVAASWNEVIGQLRHPKLADVRITKSTMHGCMGMAMDELAAYVFPMLPDTERRTVCEACMAHENAYLAVHGGKLFDNEETLLETLAAHHRLFIVSNCQKGYIEAFLKFSGFGRFFTDFLCWGDTLKPKSYTIHRIMQKHDCKTAVYVGDTQGDCDASFDAGIPFIHAAYGFGSISTPEKMQAAAASLEELAAIIE